jgi:hypothetical protein
LSARKIGARGNLTEALATLISNTHTRKRPLPLTDIADSLATALAYLHTYSAVADRISISAKMLRQFGYVARLVPEVQRLFRERRLDSVDVAVHLSMFTKKEQPIIAAALVSGEIDSLDLRAIVELRRLGTRGAIRELIDRVKRTKTQQEYIAEFVIRGNRTLDQIRTAIENYIPAAEIKRIEIDGALGRLVLSKRGKAALSRAAQRLNTRLRDALPLILHG